MTMKIDRHDARHLLPTDAVSIGILTVTAMAPLPRAAILRTLMQIGAPTWRPLGDVVAGAIETLRDDDLLAPTIGDDALAPTPWGRTVLPDLLHALPLSGTAPEIGYKLRVMALDVLEADARARQLDALLDHWRDVAALWEDAERRCPCPQPSVRGWMKHNLDLARSEIDWLTATRR
jgi:Putative AphA-like transcriptional regulator